MSIVWLMVAKISSILPTPFTMYEKTYMQTGGKNGVHTENLGYILAEMQYRQRMYPDAEW